MKKMMALIVGLLGVCAAKAADGDAFEHENIVYTIKSETDKTIVIASPRKIYTSKWDYTLTEMIIPETISYNGTTYTVVGTETPISASYLQTLVLPKTFDGEKRHFMYNLNKLTSLSIDSENPYMKLIDGILYSSDLEHLYCAIQVKNAVIKEGVKTIGEYAFWPSKGTVETVKCPSTLEVIDDYAFNWCSALHTIEFNEGLKKIGWDAFKDSGLTSVSFPSTLKEVWHDAFRESKLTEVFVPSTLTALYRRVFCHCPNLVKINVEDEHPNLKSVDGVLYSTTPSSLYTVPVEWEGETLQLENVKYIEDYALYGCKNIKKLIIPASLKRIDHDCFKNMSSLEEIVFYAESFEAINSKSWFPGCSNLRVIYIPYGTTEFYRSTLGNYNYVEMDPVPTPVENVQVDTKASQAVKTIENGKIVIIRNGEKIDLSGRKM